MTNRPETRADIGYDLPPQAVAQTPIEPRDSARLLVDWGDRVEHRVVADLPDLLRPRDLVIVNETRVLPARIPVRRPTGGRAEVLLLEERGDGQWEVLVRPSKKLAPGSTVVANGLRIVLGDDLGQGRRLVRLDSGDRPLAAVLDEVGQVPLPPYIETPLDDPERYQTVYADRPRSTAAPTAGLHFTDHVLARLEQRGIAIASVDLAIGLDTFRPIMVETLDDHVMHSELYRIPEVTVAAIEKAGRVVAVGTTVVRALETWAATGEREGRSDLFIRRPYDWQLIDVLLTNFHQPESTLLCLVDAFVGPRWRDLYRLALGEGYRFLSFGDAMLLARRGDRLETEAEAGVG